MMGALAVGEIYTMPNRLDLIKIYVETNATSNIALLFRSFFEPIMSKITMLFGALLVGISLIVLALTQKMGSPTIFIPALVGIPLLALGFLSENQPAKRKLWMHIAVSVGLLGALASIVPIILQLSKLAKGESLDPIRAGSVFSMAILCGLYVFLCVKSFINARQSARQEESV
jgi:peptidoglycan/LPS O-acetylase OafA/YrhL